METLFSVKGEFEEIIGHNAKFKAIAVAYNKVSGEERSGRQVRYQASDGIARYQWFHKGFTSADAEVHPVVVIVVEFGIWPGTQWKDKKGRRGAALEMPSVEGEVRLNDP